MGGLQLAGRTWETAHTFSHLPLLSVGLLSGMETLHSHGEPVWLKNPWAGAREAKVQRA